jgi:hypothetical protein
VGLKVEAREKEVYRSRKQTLVKYKNIIEGLEGAKQFVSTPKNKGSSTASLGTGKGLKVDRLRRSNRRCRTAGGVIYYSSVDDLCSKLAKLDASKQAGNGLDNDINSILDELFRVQALNKDEYNTLYKNIF